MRNDWPMAHAYRRPRALGFLPNAIGSGGLRSLNDSPLSQLINRRYDSTMYSPFAEEYYGHSGFHNYGYWAPDTINQRQASENLVDVLVGAFSNNNGSVLDVACGKGASTKRLLRKYDPSHVTGINISEKQLATCRRRAPGCRFLNMDATKLEFPDETFDNILCVEAAFHFDTRDRFLREAYRVLKPGGCLALSDILVRRQATSVLKRVPLANFVPDVATYRSIFERIGFENIRIVEALDQCWGGFRDHSFAYILAKVLTGQASPSALRSAIASQTLNDWAFSEYLLVSARKRRRVSPHREHR